MAVARRRWRRRHDEAIHRSEELERRLALVETGSDACDFVLIALRDSRATVVTGAGTLTQIATRLGVAPRSGPVLDAIAGMSVDTARAMEGLVTNGRALRFDAAGIQVEGRIRSAVAWLRLWIGDAGLETNPGASLRLADFVDAYADPAWLATARGEPIFANRAWCGRPARATSITPWPRA